MHICAVIQNSMYRLLQSRILANKLFREYLEKYRYYEIKILGL